MNLVQLEYFLRAVEAGSLNAAAESMGLAQPSVSVQIRRLERELGAELFVRTNRRLLLTAAGERLVPHARNTLRTAAEAASAVRQVSELSGGTVTFGVFGSAHRYFLHELVRTFRQRHPGVSLRLLGTNSVQVADGVRGGELEAGLVMTPVDNQDLRVSRPLVSTRLEYWSADPERASSAKTLGDLAQAPLILSEARWRTTDPLRRQLQAVSQTAGVAVHPVVEVEFQDAAIQIAADGDVDVIAARPIVTQLGYAQVLHACPIEPPLWESLAFVTHRAAQPSPATKLFVHLVTQALRDWDQGIA